MVPKQDPEIPPSLEEIEASLKLVDSKKQGLKRAFDHLLSHPSLLSSSVSFSWSELDSHFTSLQTHLSTRFYFLQSLELRQKNSRPSDLRVDSVVTRSEVSAFCLSLEGFGDDPSSSSGPPSGDPFYSAVTRSVQDASTSKPPGDERVATTVSVQDLLIRGRDGMLSREECIALSEEMDGKGLRKFVRFQATERVVRLDAIRRALQVAPDPGAMVLEALEGFYPWNSKSKNRCLILLRSLIEIEPNLSDGVKERAKVVALEWKGKVNLKQDSSSETLVLLNLVVAYRLENVFDVDELVDYFVVIARTNQAASLCRAVGLGDKIADLIQKLVNIGKELLAVKFIIEFGLTDKFQPVPLLQTYLKQSQMFNKKVSKNNQNSREKEHQFILCELNSLRLVIKLIDEHKLGSEYPRTDLQKRLEMLGTEKVGGRKAALSPDSKPQQQEKQQPKMHHSKQQPKLQAKQEAQKQQAQNQRQNGYKCLRTTLSAGNAAVPVTIAGPSSTIPPFRQSHYQPAGLLPEGGPFGLMGSSTLVAPYAGSSTRPYGLAGTAMGCSGNPGPTGASIYSSQPHMRSGYDNGPAAYRGCGLPPQYHAAKYPP